MTPELGHFALILALPLTLLSGVIALLGAWRRDPRMMAVAPAAALTQFGLVAFAFGCQIAAFAANDFSVKVVASHSNLELPLAYRIAASWGSHEGSILLWVLMLAGWTVAVALFSGSLPATLRARVLGTLSLITVGFLMFVLFTSNPFERLVPSAADGRDLNPLLQDPGWSSIRRCSTWVTSASPSPSHSRWQGFSKAVSTQPGPAGRGHGPRSPGLS